MKARIVCLAVVTALAGNLFADFTAPLPKGAPEGWQARSPREEIAPAFAFESRGGKDGTGALVIKHDSRAGLDGAWTKTFPVQGGRYYEFQAFRKIDKVASPRRSAIVRLLWQNSKGGK